jgi:hypothetical protein
MRVRRTEFHFIYSLTLLAACKASQNFIMPKERVRELDSGWRVSEKSLGVKPGEARRRSHEKQKKRRKEKIRSLERWPHTHGSKGGGSGGRLISLQHRQDEQVVLPKEEYLAHKKAAMQMQATLKQWADASPCNFQHQWLLIEVRASR